VEQSGKEGAMRIQYRFARLTKDQRELLEMVLMEEMDVQRWYSVTFVTALGREAILTLQ
jgi:hypothetical protein